MSTIEEDTRDWKQIKHPNELENVDLVRVSLPARILEVDQITNAYITFSDEEGNNSFRLNWDIEEVGTWSEQTNDFVIEVPVPRDIRTVRSLIQDPASVSNRKLRGVDPYGAEFEVAFQGSIGFNVYPSGTVTISDAIDSLADVFYIRDGIKGNLEVI